MSHGSDEQYATTCGECGCRLETQAEVERFPRVLEVRLKWDETEGGPTAMTRKIFIPRHLNLREARYELLALIWHSKTSTHQYQHFSNHVMIYDDLYSDEGSTGLHLLAPTPPYGWSQFYNCATSEVLHRLYFIKKRENSSQAELDCISRRLRKNAVGKSPE
jgi:hypothetical protein